MEVGTRWGMCFVKKFGFYSLGMAGGWRVWKYTGIFIFFEIHGRLAG